MTAYCHRDKPKSLADPETALSITMSEPKEQGSRLPMEFKLIGAIALSACGHLSTVAAIAVVYSLIKRARPSMESELLMLASGFWGYAFVDVFNVVAWNKGFPNLIEPIIGAGIVTVFVYTRHRILAKLLSAYCAMGMILYLMSAVLVQEPSSYQKFYIARSVLNFILLWLLVRWMRRHKLIASPEQQDVESNEHDTPVS